LKNKYCPADHETIFEKRGKNIPTIKADFLQNVPFIEVRPYIIT